MTSGRQVIHTRKSLQQVTSYIVQFHKELSNEDWKDQIDKLVTLNTGSVRLKPAKNRSLNLKPGRQICD